MLNEIQEGMEKISQDGLTATHLIIRSAEKVTEHIFKPGMKRIVNLEREGCKFAGNLFGMDVYEDDSLKKDVAYLVDMRRMGDDPEEGLLIKSYEAMMTNCPKAVAEIHDLA